MGGNRYVVEPTRGLRNYGRICGVIGNFFVVVTFFSALAGRWVAVVLLGANAVYWCTVSVRVGRVGVAISGSNLLIRNWWATYTMPLAEVRDVGIDVLPRASRQRAVYVATADARYFVEFSRNGAYKFGRGWCWMTPEQTEAVARELRHALGLNAAR